MGGERVSNHGPGTLLLGKSQRAEPGSEPALLQSDMRHGIGSTVAGLGIYGLLLLCVMAFA